MFAAIYAVNAGLSLSGFVYNYSPLVEETRASVVVLDVQGCELLFGSAYQLAREISDTAKRKKIDGGLETTVNVALAANPDAAIHAASHLEGVTFVAPGEELICLGDFPLSVLDCSLVNVDEKRTEEIFETL